ncbi:MAG: rRNA methylase, putative, group 3 [Thermoleophilia bacterium]|nr:rRNA methylase, putative, group 3 [Thermoleophilia bacterium]
MPEGPRRGSGRPKGARPGGGRPGGRPGGGAPREFGSSRGAAPADDGPDTERLVYGRHPVREAARGRRDVLAVHGTPRGLEDLAETVAELRTRGVSIRTVDHPSELDALVGTSDHQGVVADVGPFPYVGLDELLNRARAAGEAPLIFCLDQVTDPHNLGAIARVADAAGATGLLVPEHRSARVTAAAVKASAGALEHVLVARCTNLANEIERVKGPNLWAYAATERGKAEWTQVDLVDGALIVLGAEGPGIRPRVLSVCDVEVQIPMAGGVASLNVATVSAVLAFEAVRQRRAAAR